MLTKYTYKIFIASIFASIVAVGLFVFTFVVIRNKNQHASALAQTIKENLDKEENIIEYTKIIEDTKEKHELLKSYIVNQNQIGEFATYLENQGAEVGIEVKISQVALSPTDPNILIVDLEGVGNFQNTIRLLSRVENAPYKVKIVGVSLSGLKSSGWQSNIQIEVISSQF